jgi:hypothetical protein
MANGVTEADIRHWVRSYVWSGEYDGEEVVLLIEDQLGEGDEVDEGWLRGVIRGEVAAKRKAEETWPEVTDCDRLERAFQALQRQGVIALHRAGFTQSDGLDEVEEDYREAGGKASNYAGHCFYTEQVQEGALDGAGMYIGFGHLSGDDAKGVEVGHLLRAALESEGLSVEWDGTIKTRLFVKGFRWQRRSPR